MFRWFKSDYRKKIEEANNEFVRLYDENQDLKRENRLLKKVNERHRETLKVLESESKPELINNKTQNEILYEIRKMNMGPSNITINNNLRDLMNSNLKNKDEIVNILNEKLMWGEITPNQAREIMSENKKDAFPKGGIIYAKPKGEMFIPLKMMKKEPLNLLEIKLKDTDSVPEVWYKGERLDSMPGGLISIDYNWKTKGHDECFEGENNLDVDWIGIKKEGFRR